MVCMVSRYSGWTWKEVVLVGPGTKYMEGLEFGLLIDPFERLVRTISSYSQQLKLMLIDCPLVTLHRI